MELGESEEGSQITGRRSGERAALRQRSAASAREKLALWQWRLGGAGEAGDEWRGFIAPVHPAFTQQLFVFHPPPENLLRPRTVGPRNHVKIYRTRHWAMDPEVNCQALAPRVNGILGKHDGFSFLHVRFSPLFFLSPGGRCGTAWDGASDGDPDHESRSDRPRTVAARERRAPRRVCDDHGKQKQIAKFRCCCHAGAQASGHLQQAQATFSQALALSS